MSERLRFDENIWEEAAEGPAGKPRIAVCGFAGAGKSMMVNALFGEKVASVNARAGWTTVPQFVEHKLFELIDTPGFGSDGWEEDVFVSHILEPADLLVHLVNAASGVTDYDIGMYRLFREHPGLVLVLNKVDLLDSDECREAVKGVVEALNISRGLLITASGKHGIGLERLSRRMTALLPASKKTAFVGALTGEVFTKERELLAVGVVHYYAGLATALGAVPIPVADIAALAPLQVTMFLHISRIFGHQYTKQQAKSVVASLLASVGARSAAQTVVSFFKGIPGIGSLLGSAAGAAMAGASFEAFGRAVIMYFKNGQHVNEGDIRAFYARRFEEAKDKYIKRDT